MIDYEKSAILNGMGEDELKAYFEKYPGSGKKIIAICEMCERERILTFQLYSDLCHKCAMKRPEVREAARLKTIKQYATREACDAQSERLKKFYGDHPEVIDEKSKNQIKYHIDHPEIAKEHSEMMKQRHINNHEWSKEQSKRLIQYKIDHPEWSKEQSKRLIQYYIDHPEAREKARKKSIEQWSDQDIRVELGKRISAGHQGISYNEWDHFLCDIEDWRDWHNVIYLNEWFPGCHRHHITETIVVCIPAELHKYIYHNLKTGKNMGEINILALQFINGGL